MKYCPICMAYVDTETKICNDVICENGKGEKTTENYCKKCGLFLERITVVDIRAFYGDKKIMCGYGIARYKCKTCGEVFEGKWECNFVMKHCLKDYKYYWEGDCIVLEFLCSHSILMEIKEDCLICGEKKRPPVKIGEPLCVA